MEIRLDFGLYAAASIGAFTEVVRIVSNDPVSPEGTVSIEGSIAGARASIQPEFIDFQRVAVGATSILTAEFVNSGTVDLHVKKISWQYGAQFRVVSAPAPGTAIGAGTRLQLRIESVATTPGIYADRLMVVTQEGPVATLGVQMRVT
jgi:hypothetical protein